MSSEAKQTARLYSLLTDKLGGDITEAMFNYIDNKTEHSVESHIHTLATKDDIATLALATKDEIAKLALATKDEIAKLALTGKEDLAKVKYDLSKEISASVKWMFIFWIGQVATTLGIIFLFLKK